LEETVPVVLVPLAVAQRSAGKGSVTGRGDGAAAGKGKGTTGGKGSRAQVGTPVLAASPSSTGHLAAEREYSERLHTLKAMVEARADQHESEALDHEGIDTNFWQTLISIPESHHERG
jgi:hypothetical protein